MARCMLHHKQLPKSYWGEAVNTTVYLLNRAPCRALQQSTPLEAWSGPKPSVSHLKIFGSIFFSLQLQKGRDKLAEKGEKGILLGYSESSKAYRVYNPLTKKLLITRDVIVDENSSWNWNESEPRPPQIASPPSSPQKFQLLTDLYQHCQVAFLAVEPQSFKEAATNPNWKEAMDSEMHMITKNNTWELTNLPVGKKAIGVKWLYKVKYNDHGDISKHKVRLVAKGYSQKAGVDYFDTFAPVARFESVRLLIAIATQNNFLIYQMDVKSVFLNGEIKEEIYVTQPEGYITNDCAKVYKLKKALYGLKQAPRAWNQKIDFHLLEIGFTRTTSEPAMYISRKRRMVSISYYVSM
ncbi:hypothetical protein KSP39_PZI011049 [Platanthera zijinensis]|uniref:Retrovirus-related Pol polyprotein from transposon TNT 1-94 n=1 Tax=Platanthera zijinensis TaxID=2320716 RepID=A0AAP0G5N9_9ASPA